MRIYVRMALLVGLVGVAAVASAQDVQVLPAVVPGLTAEGLEAWFFSFLEKLLNLFAQFIGQILQQVFGGLGGLFTGGAPTTSV